MRKIALALFTSAVIAGSCSLSAVTAAAQGCPTLNLSTQSGVHTWGGTRELLFATVKGGSPSIKPEFKWVTTAGKGEMTNEPGMAMLDIAGVSPGTVITVEAEALGFGCTVKGRTTITVPKPDPQPCPTITVSAPASAKENELLTVSANVSGGNPDVTPTYSWTISNGTIIKGQGTLSITVDVDVVGLKKPITATVDVRGYPRDCRNVETSVTSIDGVVARKIEEVGPATKYEAGKLYEVAGKFVNNASSRVVVMFYGGRKSPKAEVEASAGQAKKRLIEDENIPAGSIQIVNGGFREEGAIELWVVPQGAAPPAATPTVDPSQVQKVADKPAPKGCPTLTLTGPTEPTPPGGMMIFSASLDGADAKTKPIYKWAVSPGKIGMGQGTDWIVVDTTGASMLITATVEVVDGLARECQMKRALIVFLAEAKKTTK